MFTALRPTCTRCIPLLLRTPILSHTTTRFYSTDPDPSPEQQERINRVLSKARALKLQHLQNQKKQQHPPSSTASKLEQYADALRRKAKEEGFASVEEMKRAYSVRKLEYKAPPPSSSAKKEEGPGKSAFERKEEELRERLRERAAEREKNAPVSSDPSSPVKPLSAIMDLNKLFAPNEDGSLPTPDAPHVSQLWTTYHTLKNKLSAVIPTPIYEQMRTLSSKYPRFVIPLLRDDAIDGGGGGNEMFYMEWTTLPTPTPHLALLSRPPTPKPTSILFTSLAEYKLRQEYARPAFVLTHYTDLAHSHGLVLMRGEISEDTGGGKMLSDAEAQRLCVTLQRFYLPSSQEGSEERSELVRIFHEEPDKFDVERLVKAATF
ncbi:hypothetical protein CF319_g4430 [Tilletia indica]|nr:hypothetical protein CF319_g4430 [Tilletia indica]